MAPAWSTTSVARSGIAQQPHARSFALSSLSRILWAPISSSQSRNVTKANVTTWQGVWTRRARGLPNSTRNRIPGIPLPQHLGGEPHGSQSEGTSKERGHFELTWLSNWLSNCCCRSPSQKGKETVSIPFLEI